MPKRVLARDWQTGFPPEFATLVKSIVTATLPALEGPFSEDEAHTTRQGLYAYRHALRAHAQKLKERGESDSYPVGASERFDKISIKVKPDTNLPNEYNVVFDLHPIVKAAHRIDPAYAQVQQLAHARFVAAQKLRPISEQMFSDDEMEERLDDIEKGSL